MVEKLRKMKMKTAVGMGILFYFLTIFIHVLILSKLIPFTWVNGGRSQSFAEQLPLSIISIIVSIIGVVFTLVVGSNKRITIICWFFVVLWSFGFIQQLLGTPFEKMVCSVVLLIGVISNLRLAIEKKDS